MNRKMKNRKEEENKTTDIYYSCMCLLVFVFMVGGLFYIEYFSDTAKQEKYLKEIFEGCMEEKAKNYCGSINKTFNGVVWIAYSNFNENYTFLEDPSQVICKDERVCCDHERYYFIEEEIDYCLNKLDNVEK